MSYGFFINNKTQDHYEVLYKGKMKVEGSWLECFIYQREGSGEVYCREVEDFYNKFTEV